MKYLLLTGATGLVGRYLLRDLMAIDLPVAVLCRSNRSESAVERVEAIMQRWEGLANRSIPRPLVLEADLCQPMLGLDGNHQGWIADNCDVILHNAASMIFREDKYGEPFRTNVDGMRNVLELCKQTGIRNFHHVSTAYICGLRNGRIYESELDLGQENGNVYEVSKMAAEKMVRAADFLNELTVYRPASVVGDTQTGYTTSSHGFYLPLQLAVLMADKVPPELMGERFLRLLGLEGHEGKNLVPVDWLSAAIVHLVTHPQHHGQTYHLTNPRPVTVELIQRVVRESIEKYSARRFIGTPTAEEVTAYENLFRQYMEIYRSHWRDDPIFDRSNTDRALPHLPCPELDHDMMLRIAGYPVQHNFILKKSEPAKVPFYPYEHLQRLLRCGSRIDSGALRTDTVGLEISGKGGGQWRLTLHDNRIIGLDFGLGPSHAPRYYLNSQTFSSLVEGRYSVDQSLLAGRVVIERESAHEGGDEDFTKILQNIVSPS